MPSILGRRPGEALWPQRRRQPVALVALATAALLAAAGCGRTSTPAATAARPTGSQTEAGPLDKSQPGASTGHQAGAGSDSRGEEVNAGTAEAAAPAESEATTRSATGVETKPEPAPESELEPEKPHYSPEIRIDLAAWQEDEGTVVLEGQTNLPPKSELDVEARLDNHGIRVGETSVKVDEEGSFRVEFSNLEEYDNRIWFHVTLDPGGTQPVALIDTIGKDGKHLEGELIQPWYWGRRAARQYLYLDMHQGQTTHTPRHDRMPAYAPGSEVKFDEVRIEPQGRRLLIKGQTNLPTGTRVELRLEAEGWVISGYDRYAWILADGSLNGRLSVPSELEGETLQIQVVFDPEYADRPLAFLFGDGGEQLTGEWVAYERGRKKAIVDLEHLYAPQDGSQPQS